jgi:hypothetical protein
MQHLNRYPSSKHAPVEFATIRWQVNHDLHENHANVVKKIYLYYVVFYLLC